MSKLIDLINQRFGRLFVVKRENSRSGDKPYWICQCNCGTIKIVSGDHLRRGNIQSCGCSRITHGHTTKNIKSRIYSIWDSMIQRCTNKNKKVWKHYGGRGITICERWLKFGNFLVDMGDPPTDKHQLDRINNDDNYCPSNCRWVVSKMNNRNRSDNYLITYDGRMQCLSAWAEEFCIGQEVLMSRIRSGWSIHRALITPVRKYQRSCRCT